MINLVKLKEHTMNNFSFAMIVLSLARWLKIITWSCDEIIAVSFIVAYVVMLWEGKEKGW